MYEQDKLLTPQQHRRIICVLVFLFALILIFLFILYNLQIVNGEQYLENSNYSITSYQTVDAARGDLLDRNGETLVTSKEVYNVTLDLEAMDDDVNSTLLDLIHLCRNNGLKWQDTLTITATTPYRFTSATPITYVETDESGAETVEKTRLAQLCDVRNVSTSLTPESLIRAFCDVYKIDSELSERDKRALVGLRYELDIRRQEITYSDYYFLEDVSIDFITMVRERNIRGVNFPITSKRVYNTPYAAHILGTIGTMTAEDWYGEEESDTPGYSENDKYSMGDYVGHSGAEYSFEEYLHGSDGVKLIESNADGVVINETWLTAPEPGNDVVLTIDIGLQGFIEEQLALLMPTLNDGKAEGAAVAVTDVKTGDVLASVSYPTYNLSTYNEDYEKLIDNNLNPLFNRATMGIYAPGSTFKPLTAIAALTDGIITPTSVVYCEGVYKFYDSPQPRCWIYPLEHEFQNVSMALTNSCNIFFYDTGRRLGIERLDKYADMFGLGKKTGIEISESIGQMASPAFSESLGYTWYDGNTMNAAIGQDNDQFTPIQLANYIATLVNGGTHNKLTILDKVVSYDGSQTLFTQQPSVLNNISLNQGDINAIKNGMLELTRTTLKSSFENLTFNVGAKTGTAQQDDSNTDSDAVFVCFGPFENPEISVAIVTETGGHGADLANLAGNIFEYYFTPELYEARVQNAADNVPPSATDTTPENTTADGDN